MPLSIEQDAKQRGIRRLCHFAPARNLTHILSDGEIRPTADLRADKEAILNPTDQARLDGYPDHISCSIEFPNVWYLRKAQQRADPAFPTWVILCLDPSLLWRDGTKFAPRNAATGGGTHVVEGYAGFNSMYAPSVSGAGGRTYSRTSSMLPSSPTDNQAEALIPGTISLERIHTVVVADEASAREVWVAAATLRALDDLPELVISSNLFDPGIVTRATRSGTRITGKSWTPDE